MKDRIVRRYFYLFLLLTLLSGCATTRPKPITPELLKKGVYKSQWTLSGSATLTNGVFRERFNPDSKTEIAILLSEHYAIGDLNGDGIDDAAVVLISTPGGSGVFYDLAVVILKEGLPYHADSRNLGDRIALRSVKIDSGLIRVEMVVQGPQDPMCCPTVAVTRTYRMSQDRLMPIN